MFSEFIPFGVNNPIRGSCVLKQVLKSQRAIGEWHLKRDLDELPLCAGGQRNALFYQWALGSSRLKLMLCPQKKLKAVNANTHRECAEIWCHCSWRGVMLSLSVLVELLRLSGGFFWVVRKTELQDWAHWVKDQKISHSFRWRQSQNPLKLTVHEHRLVDSPFS